MTSRASGQLTPQYQLSALVWAHRARFGSSLGDIYGPSLMWSIGKKSYFSYLTRNLSIVNILCISSEHKVTIVNFQGGGFLGDETSVTALLCGRGGCHVADFTEKSWNLYAHLVFNALIGGSHWNLQRCLVVRKLEWLGCHMLKKVRWYVKL